MSPIIKVYCILFGFIALTLSILVLLIFLEEHEINKRKYK